MSGIFPGAITSIYNAVNDVKFNNRCINVNVPSGPAPIYDTFDTDQIIFFNCLTGDAILNIRTADSTAGRILWIKHKSGVTPNITIETEGGELIDGASTVTLTIDDAACTLICDGNNWSILSKYNPVP